LKTRPKPVINPLILSEYTAGIAVDRTAAYTASDGVMANTAIEDICTLVKNSENLMRLSRVRVSEPVKSNQTFFSLALKKMESLRFRPLKLFPTIFCAENFTTGIMYPSP
jgi:hypothetical protein